nr:IncF plasmid conjugative transfer pilus assembly protein TraC [Klebsiella pneumoniae]
MMLLLTFFTKFLEAAWRRFRKTNCAGSVLHRASKTSTSRQSV